MDKILVVIPAYNEAQNIQNVICELQKDFTCANILVINDCSSDNTTEVLKQNKIQYISTPFNMGYSGALQLGFKFAVNNDYDFVIQFDGDGQHVALESLKLYKSMVENKSDIVIGSRFICDVGYNHTILRRIGTFVFSKTIKLMCGTTITDPTSGFQILNRKTFMKYSKMGGFPDYPDANLIIQMLLEQAKITEIPTVMREREFGVSMHSGFYKPAKYMIKMFYSIILILTGKLIFRGEK